MKRLIGLSLVLALCLGANVALAQEEGQPPITFEVKATGEVVDIGGTLPAILAGQSDYPHPSLVFVVKVPGGKLYTLDILSSPWRPGNGNTQVGLAVTVCRGTTLTFEGTFSPNGMGLLNPADVSPRKPCVRGVP